MLCIGILIFIIGCCLCSSGEDWETQQSNEDRRHRELIKTLSVQARKKNKKSVVTRRRILKDTDGKIMAEEIIEEVEE